MLLARHACAGVRISVGGSGARYCPSQVALGGRGYPLPAPSGKRWYSLQMAPAEALAAAPESPMQASTFLLTAFTWLVPAGQTVRRWVDQQVMRGALLASLCVDIHFLLRQNLE